MTNVYEAMASARKNTYEMLSNNKELIFTQKNEQDQDLIGISVASKSEITKTGEIKFLVNNLNEKDDIVAKLLDAWEERINQTCMGSEKAKSRLACDKLMNLISSGKNFNESLVTDLNDYEDKLSDYYALINNHPGGKIDLVGKVLQRIGVSEGLLSNREGNIKHMCNLALAINTKSGESPVLLNESHVANNILSTQGQTKILAVENRLAGIIGEINRDVENSKQDSFSMG